MIIHDVEQGSAEWHKLRAGRPTSSLFGNIITGTGKPSDSLDAYAHTLATEKFFGGPIDDGWQGNRFTEAGHKLEVEAKADYAMTRQVSIVEVGFITDDLMKWGTSTDGLVNNDGLVEVKSLIKTRWASLLTYLGIHNKIPPEYVPQLQGELFVAERAWVDIVFYNPAAEPIIFRQHQIPSFQVALEVRLKKVITLRNAKLKAMKKWKAPPNYY